MGTGSVLKKLTSWLYLVVGGYAGLHITFHFQIEKNMHTKWTRKQEQHISKPVDDIPDIYELSYGSLGIAFVYLSQNEEGCSYTKATLIHGQSDEAINSLKPLACEAFNEVVEELNTKISSFPTIIYRRTNREEI